MDDTTSSWDRPHHSVATKALSNRIAMAETSAGTRSSLQVVQAIAERAELHAALFDRRGDPNAVLPTDVAVRWAQLDAKEVSRLADPALSNEAAKSVKVNADANVAYAEAYRTFAAEHASSQELSKDRPATVRVAESALDAPVDPAARARIEARRIERLQQVIAEHSLNAIEPASAKDPKAVVPGSGDISASQQSIRERQPADNQVSSDEAFAAQAPDRRLAIPPEVERRYRRDGNLFYERDRDDNPVFEDKGTKLETRSNSERVAEALVLIARARGWDEIKVSGSETFRREVWLEAATLGMHVKGYTPSDADAERLGKRTHTPDPSPHRLDAGNSRPESKASEKAAPEPQAAEPPKPDTRSPQAKAFVEMSPAEGTKAYPELASAYALAFAIDRQSEAAGFSAEQRAHIAARARKTIAADINQGVYPEVMVKEQVRVPIERQQERSQDLSR